MPRLPLVVLRTRESARLLPWQWSDRFFFGGLGGDPGSHRGFWGGVGGSADAHGAHLPTAGKYGSPGSFVSQLTRSTGGCPFGCALGEAGMLVAQSTLGRQTFRQWVSMTHVHPSSPRYPDKTPVENQVGPAPAHLGPFLCPSARVPSRYREESRNPLDFDSPELQNGVTVQLGAHSPHTLASVLIPTHFKSALPRCGRAWDTKAPWGAILPGSG